MTLSPQADLADAFEVARRDRVLAALTDIVQFDTNAFFVSLARRRFNDLHETLKEDNDNG